MLQSTLAITMYTGLMIIAVLIILWWVCWTKKSTSTPVAPVASTTGAAVTTPAPATSETAVGGWVKDAATRVKHAIGMEKYDAGVQWVGNTVPKENYNPGVQWVGNTASKENYDAGVMWVGNTFNPVKEHYNTKLAHQGQEWAGANTPSGLNVGAHQGVGQGTIWQSYM